METRSEQIEKKETRYALVNLEVRAEDGGPPKLVGYAAVFNKPSERMRGWENDFVEYVAPGAFRQTLADGDDVSANLNHRGGRDLLGRTPNTLTLREDKIGLRAEIIPPDTAAGRDVVELVRRGDLRAMSFAFEMRGEKIERSKVKGEPDKRTLTDVKLFDVSIVDRPAYPDTVVALRSLEAAAKSEAPATIPLDNLRRRLALAEAA